MANEWTFERIKKFWECDNLVNIKPPTGTEFPEGFDPSIVLAQIYELFGCRAVTELGCGYGRLCTAFVPAAYRGFDINKNAIEMARQRYPKYSFDYLEGVDDLPDGDLLLGYTVFLHMADSYIESWCKTICSKYSKVLVVELLGRDWREGSAVPVFCRSLKDYQELFAPFILAYELRIPYQRYVHSEVAAHRQKSDLSISFLLFNKDGRIPDRHM